MEPGYLISPLPAAASAVIVLIAKDVKVYVIATHKKCNMHVEVTEMFMPVDSCSPQDKLFEFLFPQLKSGVL